MPKTTRYKETGKGFLTRREIHGGKIVIQKVISDEGTSYFLDEIRLKGFGKQDFSQLDPTVTVLKERNLNKEERKKLKRLM